jgi:hypothetical protein
VRVELAVENDEWWTLELVFCESLHSITREINSSPHTYHSDVPNIFK